MLTPRLEFGLALDFASASDTLERRLDAYVPILRLAERLGFRTVVAGETYPTRPSAGHLPSPLLALAALAPRTTLQLATGVVLLPAWPVQRLAYDAAVLDQISGGRLSLGVGVGQPGVWERFGVARADVAQLADESLAALKALWSGQTGFRGERVVVERGIAPLPVQPGGPPIWVGGMAPRAARRSALLGDAWYGATQYTRAEVARQVTRYRQAQAEAGRPATTPVVINRLLCLAEDARDARTEYGPFVEETLRRYAAAGALNLEAARQDSGSLLEAAAGQVCLLGSPDDVAAQLDAYAAAGVTAIQLHVAPADMPADLVERAVQLFGERVLSRFRPAAQGS